MDEIALRNFKEFALLYNQMTERCFARCVDSMQTRILNTNEQECVDDCASKFIKYNNKLMSNFVKIQSASVQQKMLEQQLAQVNNEVGPKEVAVSS